jgi:N-acetyl-gamma-glutamyl-phosphate reductase
VVFCTLPHGQSQALAPALVDTVGHVVDLGADFRLPRAEYEHWYGEAHAAPELIDRFAYGMTELYRAELADARHVAAPGCYPTAASLALAPLLP